MPLLEIIRKVATANGRAFLALKRAKFFAIGPIGPAARVPSAERALVGIIRGPEAVPALLGVLRCGSVPGQLYALLGLYQCRYDELEGLLKTWRGRQDEVVVRTACFVSSQKISKVVANIEGGTYSRLLEAHEKG